MVKVQLALVLTALSFATGYVWLLSFLFDDWIPWSPRRLREDLQAARTAVRLSRQSRRTIDAMVAEARRQWQADG